MNYLFDFNVLSSKKTNNIRKNNYENNNLDYENIILEHN